MYIDKATKLAETASKRAAEQVARSEQILKDKKGIDANGIQTIDYYVGEIKFGEKYVIGDVVLLENCTLTDMGIKILKVVK